MRGVLGEQFSEQTPRSRAPCGIRWQLGYRVPGFAYKARRAPYMASGHWPVRGVCWPLLDHSYGHLGECTGCPHGESAASHRSPCCRVSRALGTDRFYLDLDPNSLRFSTTPQGPVISSRHLLRGPLFQSGPPPMCLSPLRVQTVEAALFFQRRDFLAGGSLMAVFQSRIPLLLQVMGDGLYIPCLLPHPVQACKILPPRA